MADLSGFTPAQKVARGELNEQAREDWVNNPSGTVTTPGGTVLKTVGQVVTDAEAVIAAGVSDLRVVVAPSYAVAQALTSLEDGRVVHISGGTSVGDGREGKFIYHAGDFTAKVTSDPLGGIYLPLSEDSDGSEGCLVRQGGWKVSGADARWWGVLADFVYNPATFTGDGTDNQPMIAAALATTGVTKVILPAGHVMVDDKTSVAQFKVLEGQTEASTVIWVKDTFNLSATAIFDTGSGLAAGRQIRNLEINHCQPDSATRGDLVAYPPAIDVTAAFSVIEDVTIKRAIKGVVSSTNAGGTQIRCLKGSAFNGLLDIDGWEHSGFFEDIDSGVYDMTANMIAHRNDGTYYDVTLGRIDDMKWKGGIVFRHPKALRLKSNATFGEINALNLDDYGGLYVEGGRFKINGSMTLGQTDGIWGSISGGSIDLAMKMSQSVLNTDSLLQISGSAEVDLSGTELNAETAADVHLVEVTSGAPVINDAGLRIKRSPTTAYTKEFLKLAGATGSLTGIHMMSRKTSGSGTVLTSTADARHIHLAGNYANGWTEGQLNGWRSWTPTISATSGTLNSTSLNTAQYRVIDGMAEGKLNFRMDDKGTAAADAQLLATLPLAAASGTGNESHISGREMASPGANLSGRIEAGGSNLSIAWADGTAQIITTVSDPSALNVITDAYRYDVSFRYRVAA